MKPVLAIFLAASVFEVLHLFRSREKKEAAVYLVLAAAALGLAVYMMANPQYDSFAKLALDLLGVNR